MIFRMLHRDAIKIMGDRGLSLDLARGRLVLLSAFFILAFMLMGARVVDLTLIKGPVDPDQLAAVSEEKAVTRGAIYDRNGELLAVTLRMSSLYADAVLIDDPVVAAKGLVEIFPELSYGDVLQKLQSKKRFVWLRRNITPEQQYEVLALGQPGLQFEMESSRVYPQGPLASHLVGYNSIDNKGLAGIERSFQELLDSGQDLHLTLDVRLQHALRREINQAISEFDAKAGAGLIMDVTNGEVLAGVSLPDFDPNRLNDAQDKELFNRLSLGVYELGSMFKIFSTAALIEFKNAPMDTTFDATEPIKVGRFTINDYHAEDRILTVPEVFMYSSNIGSALMGQMVGTEGLREFYQDLGLLDPLDFEIKEIGRPIVPSPWREVSTLTASYGHGIATSPLQLTSAVAAIVNGGYAVHPTLVLDQNGEETDRSSQKGQGMRVVSSQTAHRMRQLMRLVVTDGTGKSADVPGYIVGGKTGTAEKSGARGYDHNRLISSFVGVFPMDDPHYVVLVMVDEPHGNKASFGYATGGWVAAPAVARVIKSAAAILGIPALPESEDHDLGASLKQYVNMKGHIDG